MTNWKTLLDVNPEPSLLDAIAHAEKKEQTMKRWNVRYGPDGEVLEVKLGLQEFVTATQTPRIETRVQGNWFYCTATDELGALARFMEVKEQAK